MNCRDDFITVEKLVSNARRSLGREVMRQGIRQIVESIRQELGNHRNRIDDPARFLEELRRDKAAEDLLTPEICELLEAFRKSTKSVSEPASVSVGSASILPPEPKSPTRKAAIVSLLASRPATVSLRPEPLPPPVRARTGPISPEEQLMVLQRFENILDKIADNPNAPRRFLKSLRELYAEYSGRFDEEFQIRLQAFCTDCRERMRSGDAVPKNLLDVVCGQFPELFLSIPQRIPKVRPESLACDKNIDVPKNKPSVRAKTGPISPEEQLMVLQRFENILDKIADNPNTPQRFLKSLRELYVEYSGRFDEEFQMRLQAFCTDCRERMRSGDAVPQNLLDVVCGQFPELFLSIPQRVPKVRPESPACDKNIDVPKNHADEIARRKSYMQKRIMAMARNTGEVSVDEVFRQLQGITTSWGSVKEVILELEKQGFLELLRTESNGSKIYRPTSSPIPINPEHPGPDDMDEVLMKMIRSRGSVTRDVVYARELRMSESVWIIRLEALVKRGLLRRVGDKEDERFFPV